jgi:hypothetical protein
MKDDRYNKMKALGLCTMCRKVSAVEGKVYCVGCSTKRVDQNRKRSKRAISNNVCGYCCQRPNEMPDENNFPLCAECYFRRTSKNHFGTELCWEALKHKMEQQNYLCPYTGEKLILGYNASLEHRYPKSRFPDLKDDLDNI